jgi:hypothetical protein
LFFEKKKQKTFDPLDCACWNKRALNEQRVSGALLAATHLDVWLREMAGLPPGPNSATAPGIKVFLLLFLQKKKMLFLLPYEQDASPNNPKQQGVNQ